MKRGGKHMARDSFDDKISEALKRSTKQSSEALHEENFRRIMNKINDIDKGDRKMPKRKSALGKIISIGTVAAVMLITIGTFTQPGQAALEKIRQYFEPEKQVEHEIEGDKEVIDSRLQQSEMGYVIYYDQDRYKVVEGEEADRIVMKETYEGIPEVYMEISQNTEKTPEELAAILEAELKADFSKVNPAENVTDPVEGIYIHAIDGGTNWDDEIVNYYLVDNTQGGTFIIKQKYFLEAAEGHGARFYNMLKEFVIVEEGAAE
jgi:hypothetical protein